MKGRLCHLEAPFLLSLKGAAQFERHYVQVILRPPFS